MKKGTLNTGGDLLMIFVKNREVGKVKTRLAKTIGDLNALKIYDVLLKHTKEVSLNVSCFRMVLYSEYIDFNDIFPNQYFIKDEQNKGDLGDRMKLAFKENFKDEFNKILCIGSDCYELDPLHIVQAFEKLDSSDVVIGPAVDGGYYLIGMKDYNPQLFENKKWSTSNVLLDTILDLKELRLTYQLLPTLSDVDEIDDLAPELKEML
ncbi:MAG: TIGR04282 family arsenosugar biosynthesis glycosyltransferase [Salibacteraceae bacterium]